MCSALTRQRSQVQFLPRPPSADLEKLPHPPRARAGRQSDVNGGIAAQATLRQCPVDELLGVLADVVCDERQRQLVDALVGVALGPEERSRLLGEQMGAVDLLGDQRGVGRPRRERVLLDEAGQGGPWPRSAPATYSEHDPVERQGQAEDPHAHQDEPERLDVDPADGGGDSEPEDRAERNEEEGGPELHPLSFLRNPSSTHPSFPLTEVHISHPGTGKEALARDRSPSGERVGEQHDHRGHGEGAGGQHQQPRLAVRVIERVPTRSVLLIATARRARSVFTPIRSRWLAVWWNTKSGGWVGLRAASRPRRSCSASERQNDSTDSGSTTNRNVLAILR